MAPEPPPTKIQPVFYYDLGSPDCYLVAERIMSALPAVPEWEAVHGRSLGALDRDPDRELTERRAAELATPHARRDARCNVRQAGWPSRRVLA